MLKIKYEGIDDWNRPVFKDINSENRFGSVEILFPYWETEKSVLEKISEKHLCYFGKCFDGDPMGGIVKGIKIIRSDEIIPPKQAMVVHFP